MNDGILESSSAEKTRIRAVYGKREVNDERYSWFNPGHQFIAQQRERRLLDLLRRYGFAALQSKSILEVGCGTGQWLRDFVKWGARPDKLAGIDLLADRLSTAQQLCSQGVRIQCADAAQLPFADNVFDLVFQSTVFTSILDSELRHRVAAEMMRVLKRDGVIVWYDYHLNNPWNQDVRGVKRREIYKLFSDCTVDLKRITLLPAVARTLAPYSYFGCYLLEKVPLLCSHYLGVIRKN